MPTADQFKNFVANADADHDVLDAEAVAAERVEAVTEPETLEPEGEGGKHAKSDDHQPGLTSDSSAPPTTQPSE